MAQYPFKDRPAMPGVSIVPKQTTDIARLREAISFSDQLMGHTLHFHTTWGLFSPKGIDDGSRLLLKHLEVKPDERALDLGCGYGPLGMSIARNAPQGHCLMVDKDFIAIEYAQANLQRNQIDNAQAMLSDGLQHIPPQTFSLVVSNLPAKTSKEHYYLFFHDIYQHLEPQGHCYVVVINGLRRFIERAFGEVFGNHKKVKQGKTYTVAMATKT